MSWVVIGLLVLGGIVLIALLWNRLSRGERWEGADPLFVAGVALTAVGAATITTLGMFMLAVLAAGIALMAISIGRNRRHTGPR